MAREQTEREIGESTQLRDADLLSQQLEPDRIEAMSELDMPDLVRQHRDEFRLRTQRLEQSARHQQHAARHGHGIGRRVVDDIGPVDKRLAGMGRNRSDQRIEIGLVTV